METAFSQIFHIRKLGEITLFYVVLVANKTGM